MEGQFDDADEDGPTISETPKILPENLPVNLENLKIEDLDEDYYDSDYDGHSSDDYYDYETVQGKNGITINHAHANTQQASRLTSYQPTDKVFKKFSNKINVGHYEGPAKAFNTLMEKDRKSEAERMRAKDKQDRATVEQVLDPRTRIVLFKLLNRGQISEINGCISTGKEANVYHATNKLGEDFAIKIYKTSILIFKDRDRYVSGEYRFRHGYCRHNPRKMVRTWAEKEMRNLVRMHGAGIAVPSPILLRGHVLLMSFVGRDGWAAPKLKDVELSCDKARELYYDCVVMIWKMYNKCRLVHADLSEFNILYHAGKLVIIDVSQSVEHDHPHALEFLRKDCTNVSQFFLKHGVSTMTVKELFDFTTDPTVSEETMEKRLEELSEKIQNRNVDELTAQQKIDEEVFKNAFIPKRLNEVYNAERDVFEKEKGGDLIYKTITGLHGGPKGNKGWETESEETCSSDEEDEIEKEKKLPLRPKNETAEERRARKKVIKDEKAEKRKTKTPKHVKKRKEKQQKAKK